jgi:alpha,alpha-trehalose-phosphate synthase [UDP-forming]
MATSKRAARKKRRLVVVANRGPLRSEVSGGRRRWVRSAGGLVAALDPVLRQRGGVWVSAEEAEPHSEVPVEGPELDYDTRAVSLSRTRQQGFYLGVSNAVLWPLLHSFPPTARVGEAPWDDYVHANRAFVDEVLASSTQRDLVWIQDYHLMLMPGMLRRKRGKARIGWFCHVPWPNPDLFEILPWRREILEGLLGADIVGFHTDVYAQNFLECVERLTDLGVDHARRTVRHGDRITRAVAAPIGIPVEEIQAIAADPEVNRQAEELRRLVGGRRIILGVDRLDYTKGIPERILGWERVLRARRAARNELVLVQIMVPSRTAVQAYAALKDEVDRLVGHVNGRFGSTGRVPIHYLYRNLDQRTLFAHYRAADVALVTPLRDGMNLVAQEYVASRVDDDGALVLSEFAGAAEYLHEAVLVNPYDIGGLAAGLEEALGLPRRELKRRMRAMRGEVARLDVHRWADGFIQSVEHG